MPTQALMGRVGRGAYSSAGEHFVDIEGVTGSIPVTPTIKVPRETLGFLFCPVLLRSAVTALWWIFSGGGLQVDI